MSDIELEVIIPSCRENLCDNSSTMKRRQNMSSSGTLQLIKTQLNRTELRVIVYSDVDSKRALHQAEERDYILDIPSNATLLCKLIFNQKYDEAVRRLCENPEESSTWMSFQIDDDCCENSTVYDENSKTDLQRKSDMLKRRLQKLSSPRRCAFKQLPIHMACHNLSFLAATDLKSPKTPGFSQKTSLEKLIIHLALTYPTGCTMSDHYGRYPLHQVLGDSRCRNGNILVSKETLSILLMAAPQIANYPDRFGRLPIDIVGGTLRGEKATEESQSSDDDENDFDTDTVFDMLNRGPDFWHLARQEAMVCLQLQSPTDDRLAETKQIYEDTNSERCEPNNIASQESDSLEPDLVTITNRILSRDGNDAETNESQTMQTAEIPQESSCGADTATSSTLEALNSSLSNDQPKKDFGTVETRDSLTVKTAEMSDESSVVIEAAISYFSELNEKTLKDSGRSLESRGSYMIMTPLSGTVDQMQEILVRNSHFFVDTDEKQSPAGPSSLRLDGQCSNEKKDEFNGRFSQNFIGSPIENNLLLPTDCSSREDLEMSTISTSPTQSIASHTGLGERVNFLKQMLSESFHANYELTQKISEMQDNISHLNQDAEYWKTQFHSLNEKQNQDADYWKTQFHSLNEKQNNDSTYERQESIRLKEEVKGLRQREAKLLHEVKCLNIALEANGISFMVPKIGGPLENSKTSSTVYRSKLPVVDAEHQDSKSSSCEKEMLEDQTNQVLAHDVYEINHERQKLESENLILKEKELQYLSDQQAAKDRIVMLEKIVEMASQPRQEIHHQTSEVHLLPPLDIKTADSDRICQLHESVTSADNLFNIENDDSQTLKQKFSSNRGSDPTTYSQGPIFEKSCSSLTHPVPIKPEPYQSERNQSQKIEVQEAAERSRICQFQKNFSSQDAIYQPEQYDSQTLKENSISTCSQGHAFEKICTHPVPMRPEPYQSGRNLSQKIEVRESPDNDRISQYQKNFISSGTLYQPENDDSQPLKQNSSANRGSNPLTCSQGPMYEKGCTSVVHPVPMKPEHFQTGKNISQKIEVRESRDNDRICQYQKNFNSPGILYQPENYDSRTLKQNSSANRGSNSSTFSKGLIFEKSCTYVVHPVPLKPPRPYQSGRNQSQKIEVREEDPRRAAAFVPITIDTVIDMSTDKTSRHITDSSMAPSEHNFSDMNPDGHFLMHMEAPMSSPTGLASSSQEPYSNSHKLSSKITQAISNDSRSKDFAREARPVFVDVSKISENSMSFHDKPIEIEDAELAYAATLCYRQETQNETSTLGNISDEKMVEVKTKNGPSEDQKSDDIASFFKSLLTTESSTSGNHRHDGKLKQIKKRTCRRDIGSNPPNNKNGKVLVQYEYNASSHEASQLVQHPARRSDQAESDWLNDVDSILIDTENMFGLKLSPEIIDAWHSISIDD